CLQLRKLGRATEAAAELAGLQGLLEGQLQGVTPLPPGERRSLLVQLMRVARRWWSPVRLSGPITWAENLVRRTHVQLDQKDGVISLHRAFAVGQRYSVYLLEGALAAARAGSGEDTQERSRLNQVALDRFDAALALEGRNSDAVVLELRCLQLRKLG